MMSGLHSRSRAFEERREKNELTCMKEGLTASDKESRT